MGHSSSLDEGLDRLQELLLAMEPGDEVSAERAAEICGLEARHCGTVLDALTRAGLMVRGQREGYVRCRLEFAGQGP